MARSIQTSFRLPRELYERLVEAAGEKGLAEEIRRRLEASFEAKPSADDPKTKQLVDAIEGAFGALLTSDVTAEELTQEMRRRAAMQNDLRLRLWTALLFSDKDKKGEDQ